MTEEAENYRKAIACIYNTLVGNAGTTDYLKPLSASTTNELAEFCKAIYKGMIVEDYFENRENQNETPT